LLDVYSDEILFVAQPILRFEQIAKVQNDLTALPGQTVKFLKYTALTGSSVLAETADLETGTISTTTLSITVAEHGKALRFSESLLRTSVTDQLANAAILLGNHYGVARDGLVRDALMAGTNIKYAKSRADRASLISTDTFDVDLVREVVEFLATNKAPKFGDGYVAMIHPHQGKALRANAAWVNAQLYTTPENILKGEAGRIEDVRFVETTQIHRIPAGTQDIYADGSDTGSNTSVAANAATDVYRSVAVGQYAVGIAEALPVEMRDNGVENFGRYHSIAYYGIYGAGLLETGHSVIAETA